MIVPRAFIFSSSSNQNKVKRNGGLSSSPAPVSTPREDSSGLRLPSDLLGADRLEHPTHTNPVVIPPKRGSRVTPVHLGLDTRERKAVKPSGTPRRSSSVTHRDRNLPLSVVSLLEATAIQVPRRSWTVQESRKQHRPYKTQDVSRLFMDEFQSKEESLLDSTASTPLDILLSPPDEGPEKCAQGNDYDPESPFSIRSMSSESMPSLAPDCESPSSVPIPATPASPRSPMERKCKFSSLSEDCASDHPLLESDSFEFDPCPATKSSDSVSMASTTSITSFPHLKLIFKSNLTASLRAIRSAAQSVSTFATPSIQSDYSLTRSLLSISPELTDDRRPLPMSDPPSPALRRYLNPTPISPAEMHVYHDRPHEPSNGPLKCSVSIQMKTYYHSGSDDDTVKCHSENSTSADRQNSCMASDVPPVSRPREPRENSDFLRMVVLEMNMRRCGKLRDDTPMRAKIWLPPRKGQLYRAVSFSSFSDEGENNVPTRWVGVSVECI